MNLKPADQIELPEMSVAVSFPPPTQTPSPISLQIENRLSEYDRDKDCLYILPLSIIPLETPGLKRARLVKNARAIAGVLERTRTPVFLGEKRILADRFRTLANSLSSRWPKHVIAYSFKTNYAVASSNFLEEIGAWAEVVSGREYQMARELGYPGERIVYNGPFNTANELERAQMEGAIKYVTLNLVSSAFFLAAIGILYGMVGTLNMADLAVKLQQVQEPGLVTTLRRRPRRRSCRSAPYGRRRRRPNSPAPRKGR